MQETNSALITKYESMNRKYLDQKGIGMEIMFLENYFAEYGKE